MESPQYLGDSVYAQFDGYHITLTTNNGFGPSNTIHLEDAVFLALERYAKIKFEHLKTADNEGSESK